RCPLRRYARLVGAPNCAPSLCSVAGLLHALTLQSAYEDTSPLATQIHNCTRATNSPRVTDAAPATLCTTGSARHPRPRILRSRGDTPSRQDTGRPATRALLSVAVTVRNSHTLG